MKCGRKSWPFLKATGAVIELPLVSVIVPVWNSPDLIARCLAALKRQNYPKNRFEVIVVDNGSTDNTAKIVRLFAGVQLVAEAEPGSYQARNTGLKRATGEYVAFTDADCVPTKEWLQALVEAARNCPNAGIVAGCIELFVPTGGGCKACIDYERIFAFDQTKNVANNLCVTANWLSPRALLIDHGGFRHDLKSGGDGECARRITAAGRDIVYAARAIVHHPVRGNAEDLVRKRRRVVGGRIKVKKPPRNLLTWMSVMSAEMILEIVNIFKRSNYGLRHRMRIAGISVMLYGHSIAELVRLAKGGDSLRS